MRTLIINGTRHTLTTDGMGITYIDGLLIDDFMDNLSEADTLWLAQYGMNVAKNEPEHYEDICERIEMPREVKSGIDSHMENL